MALVNIADELQPLSLADLGHLSFCPSGDQAWLGETFDDIPRYPFRVFSTKSAGITNASWAKSMEASSTPEKGRVDIFARQDNQQVASMLNMHLEWCTDSEDNFVSWSSSLLFALVHIFRLHRLSRNPPALDDISLCIIDTTKLPKDVFLRDLDLIKAYSPFDSDLIQLEDPRKDLYFGEYLSQGALKIEGRCKIVSAQLMVDQGLYRLWRELEEFTRWGIHPRPLWERPIIELRNCSSELERPQISIDKIRLAVNVAQLFGPGWTLPMAANLIALISGSIEDASIIQVFNANVFTDDDKRNCSSSMTKVKTFEGLFEVEAFGKIMQVIYKDFCVTKLKSKTPIAFLLLARMIVRSQVLNVIVYFDEAEVPLRHAVIFMLNEFVLNEMPEHQDSALDSIRRDVIGRLDTVANVNQQLYELLFGTFLN